MKEKKCKKCWEPRGHSLMNSLCFKCINDKENSKEVKVYSIKRTPIKPSKNYTLKRTPIKRNQKPLKRTPIKINTDLKLKKSAIKMWPSKTNRNTPAKFSKKTKDEILKRDIKCIISWNPIEEYHHSFFWSIQANYWEDRNAHYEWVWLSAKVHYIIHHWKDTELAKKYREICVDYSTKMRLKFKKYVKI